jgi:molybdopterin molybdotransferase
MISVQEAERIILDSVGTCAAERVPLAEAQGHVLRQPINADRDLPPFDRVTMDGIAIAADPSRSVRTYRIEAIQPAGAEPLALVHPGSGCIQVMTGAVLPKGCDTVIPVEEISIDGESATVETGLQLTKGQFVHQQGSDEEMGATLLEPGCLLTSPRIALAATTGIADVLVTPYPKVAIVSNGDELVDIGTPVLPHQIRPSNNYGMLAALKRRGFEHATNAHLPDDPAIIEEGLARLVGEHDAVVLSGGVSAGDRDYIPRALLNIGVTSLFHKVSQRPGKPMWYGKAETGQPVFALPGNPISTLACFHRFVLPALNHMMAATPPDPVFAQLDESESFDLPLTYFRPVRELPGQDGILRVIPAHYQGSGDLSVLAKSDGFVELAQEVDAFPAGTVVPYTRWG